MFSAGLFDPVGTIILESNASTTSFCKSYPIDRRHAMDTSRDFLDCEEKSGYRFVPLNPVQVLKVSQLGMIFASLGAGLALALAVFALELTVRSYRKSQYH